MDDHITKLEQLKISRTPLPSPPKRTAKTYVGRALVAFFVLLTTCLLLWQASFFAKQASVKVFTVETIRHDPNPSAPLLIGTGYIVARRQSTISAKITDRVVEVPVQEGDKLAAGDVIAKLDDNATRAAVNVAQAKVSNAEAEFAAAQHAAADAAPLFARKQLLLSKGLLSEVDFDSQKASYDASQDNVRIQQAALSEAKMQLTAAEIDQSDTVIRAPYAGIITTKDAQPGEVISPQSNGQYTRTGICTIVDRNSLEADVEVSENFISKVKPGDAVVVTLNAYPSWTIPGNVLSVDPTADEAKATVKVRVKLNDIDDRIFPQMGASVQFLGNTPVNQSSTAMNDAVYVPKDAIFTFAASDYVYLIANGRLARQKVKKEQSQPGDEIQVTGLKAGDVVVRAPDEHLVDGQAVTTSE